MTSPQQPVEPWLSPAPAPATSTVPAEPSGASGGGRRGLSPRTPMLIGLLTFAVTLLLFGLLAVVGGSVFDSFSRGVEMRQLLSRIEASEDAMSQLQAQEARAVESYRAGTLSTEQLSEQLTEIAGRGAVNVAAAGERVAAVEWFAWHKEVRDAQVAYLAHNQAWVEYLRLAAADPAEFGRPQDAINETFQQARQPLLDAVPGWDPLDVRERVDALFVSPEGSGGGQQV